MKTLKYIALVALTISFAACEQEDFSPSVQGDPDAVKISATIGALQTRVIYDNNGVTTFQSGDEIRVISHTRQNKNKDKSDAVYKFDGAMDWEPTDPAKYVVWEGITDNTFYGVYPATAEYTTFTIPDDQSDDITAADWMTDDYTANKSVGNVKFDFRHRLSKVTVNITEWNDEFGGVPQTVSTPKIYSKGIALTATYDDSGVTITATGSDTGIDPLVSGASYTAIVAPVKYGENDKFMTFTVAGQDMTVLATASQLKEGLQSGNHYTFNLTVGKNAVTIESVSVTKWDEQDIDGGVAKECEHETTVNNGACAVCGKQVYVDLGLSVNWATVNIGATKPEEVGDFFAWGETAPKETYNWSTYTWCNGSNNTMTKYCTNSSYGYNGFTDNITELELADDAAVQNWGDGWMMPALEQMEELLDENNCTRIWTTVNGVNGYQITSKVPGYEGNSIFLPFALYKDDSGLSIANRAVYWTRKLSNLQTITGSVFIFNSYNYLLNGYARSHGCLIRPVREK